MSIISFENYGRRAEADLTYTEKAGRHDFQRRAEAKIADDVVAKLDLNPEDDLLEIGCGAGNLLIPLAFRVNRCTGIDHPSCIKALEKRFSDPSMTCVAGNFLEIELRGGFSKILVYSVIHLLADHDEVARFVDKALGLLRPGGRMLIGDVPNADRAKRFLASNEGRLIDEEYSALRERSRALAGQKFLAERDERVVAFGEADLVELVARLRERGYDAFLVPQPRDLPFAHTREDVLIHA